MAERIGVECIFTENGAVRVRRIKRGGAWIRVGQGRQWQDGNGRHILVMLPNQEVLEIVQRPDTLLWEMEPNRGSHVQWI
jgi:hypothetical protein